ncbi:cupin [uncultured Jannaschia sp.]|uniref:cupin n=1 Tax=uncultured Jannaschia sp. TaxID=293347 RepID=UPI0026271398|nr:cupin [uncultured Jannaschia sp.]
MIYHHLYSDADGESRWRDVTVDLEERSFAPPARAIEISAPRDARRSLFLRLRAGWNEPIHPTPVRQMLVPTAGRIRVTASDGEAREIAPGRIWLMEDRSGKGHHTEVIGDEDFLCVIVQYD